MKPAHEATTMPVESHWDCLVVGAGLAGTTAALQLARRGVRVLLVDRAAFPRHKVCGGCLNQRALNVLQHLGMDKPVRDLGAVPLTSFELAAGRRTLRLEIPPGRGVSRAALDACMVEAVRDAGGFFVAEAAATLEPNGTNTHTAVLRHPTGERRIHARVILAADGLHGSLMKKAGYPARVAANARVGAGALMPPGTNAFEPGVIHMAVSRAGYVGATVVEQGKLDVAAAFDATFVRDAGGPSHAAERVLREAGFPIPDSLHDVKWRGTPPLTRRASALGTQRLFVLGDAAGYIEPFTGEGMAWALTSGYLVAPLVQRTLQRDDPQSLREWQRLFQQHVRGRQLVCRTLARMLRSPLAVQTAMTILRRQPGLANPVLRHMNAPVR